MTWWRKEDSLRFFSLELTGTQYEKGLKGLDADALAAATARMHCNILVIFALGHGCVAYYPSRVFPRHAALGGRNLVGQLVKACRKRGIKLMAYNCAHNLNARVYRSHPDWGIVERGREKKAAPEGGVAICINSPFQDVFIKGIREVVSLGVDGMFFDGLGRMGHCVCKYCRALFHEQTGGNLLKADRKTIDKWVGAELGRIAQRYHGAIKSLNPNCMFFVNGLDASSTSELSDAVGAEAFFGLRGRFLPPLNDAGTVGRMVAGCALPGQSKIVYSRYAQSPWAHHTNTDAELELATYRSVAAGVEPWYSGYDTGFFGYPEGIPAIGRANAFIKKAGRYIRDDTDEAKVLVLERENTTMEMELFTEPFRGFTEALTRYRIPWDAMGISRITPERLAGYDLVIVPEQEELSATELEILADHAERGRKMILTGRTAFADEMGRKRAVLPDVFGFSPSGLPEYRCKVFQHAFNLTGYVHPASGSWDILGDFAGRPVIPCYFRVQRVKAARSSRVLAWIENRDLGSAYSQFLAPRNEPALLLNAGGNVIYSAADIDTTYHRNRGAAGGTLMRRLVEYFLGKDCAMQTNAPESVEISVRRQLAQGRVLVHMVNATSASIRPIEDIVEVRDIAVAISAPKPRRVFSLRGRKVRSSWRAGKLSIRLDRLDRYDIIVVET